MSSQIAVVHEQRAYQNFYDLHHDSSGIICVSQIREGQWKNKYGRHTAMYNYMSELESQDDIFFCQNTFKRFKRSTEYLFELKALYIDLDFYKRTEYTKAQILGNIEILVQDGKFPMPTHIVDSGHGINLIWRIKRTPADALPLWRVIEQYLYEQLEDLGADKKALDVTRVFRPADTYNAKYNQKNKVSIIYSSPIEYDIHLFKDYVQFASPQKKTKGKAGTITRLFNQYSLYYSRYLDLLTICKLRNYDVAGYRELILFLYRYYGCCYLADEELALENALQLNSKFVEPLAETEVRRATRSAERAAQKQKYNYRNQTIVNMLDITDEEMLKQNSKGEYYIKTIITKEIKYLRNNKRRYKAKRDEKGLTDEDKRQMEIMRAIAEQRALGLSQQAVADLLGITKRTVQRYEKKIQEQQLQKSKLVL